MGLMTKQKVSPKGKLNKADIKKILVNILVFTSPATAAFFSLLAQGVEFSKAWPVAAVILYQAIADFLKKLNDGTE